MRIVLLGPPGSGKAELSEKLSSQYGMPVITVASVMQRAAAEPSELGRLAKEAMEMSRVSDELLLALLRIQIPQMDLSKGFVLVDFPKNAGQADVLDSVLNDLGVGIELVLNLEVDPDELMERLVGRITCDNCGAQYNTYVNPPMVEGVCDVCGARVTRRPDDYEETISNRLRVYEGQMGPLLQYYQLSEKLQRLAADKGIAKVWGSIRKMIDALPREKVAKVETPVKAGKLDQAPIAAAKEVADTQAVAGKTGVTKPAKPKASTKKPTVKKAAVKKAVPKKKPTAKKVATKKSTAKTSATKAAAKKKVVTKKKAVAKKKVAAKKVAAKKTQAKKKVVKKAAAKKATTKKAVSRKVVAKKTTAKKTTVKKAASKKTSSRKKPTAKKAVAKKVLTKKKSAPSKKATTKKATSRTRPTKKVAANKKVVKKRPVKKVVARKAPAGKAKAKKKVAAKSKKKSARR